MVSDHVQALVIGSGFGGSVMAYRLAEAGLHVRVLERGKSYPPGSFPRSPRQMRGNFWDPSEGLFGLFNLWSFRGLEAVVSSGLGGGSLIYANVLIRMDEKSFVREDLARGGYEVWPVSRDDIDPHYARVEAMLGANPYPLASAPYDMTFKTHALKDAATRLGLRWYLPNLAVTFAEKDRDPIPGQPLPAAPPNLHGTLRYTCRLCGECDIGCNYGSKNTLDYNYLTEAKRLGADIRTLCEVRSFEPRDGGGYTVHYVQHDPGQPGEGQPRKTSHLPLHSIHTDRLILSAGAIGSTFLLLKNRAAFPGISKTLGSRFCDNGDLLTIALNCTETSSGSRNPRVINPSFGPVITSTIFVPDGDAEGEGAFYLQDAGFPEFASWLVEATGVLGIARRAAKLFVYLIWLRMGRRLESDIGAEIGGLLGSSQRSSRLLPLLGMGLTTPRADMRLKQGRLDIDWQRAGHQAYFNRVRTVMHQISDALGAKFADNPVWHAGRGITVHPLGGCPMGRNPADGVVDDHGEVFGYPGFFIADGSVMPGPVGANPSLTIAALADRFADRAVTSYP